MMNQEIERPRTMSSIYTTRSANALKEASIYDSQTFGQDFRIHVNEAVGSASISPGGRDVVLASQQGLHIIDLDSPFQPPRHLKHQTPWTPADVQWSSFASRYSWIVSTSNQRALVWNLEMSTRQAPIEHTLHAHSRAITDINFSVFHPDMLATCAVDAFVHCWDLRIPARPVVSFSDWFAGATQVKWNRQNEHIIASSHDRNLRIWDDRKGALPLKTIEAHETKIYGIDWNRTRESKIITCSLDCTIKLWDYEVSEEEPERTIDTPYPVWRARHTPFGSGVLAMPQRGNNDLHMYDTRAGNAVVKENSLEVLPNYSFTGHREQAKEFLWRARGTIDNRTDDRDFQLVTWGADRELILHRIGPRQLQAVGSQKGMQLEEQWNLTRRGAPYKTFREKPTTPITAISGVANSGVANSGDPMHSGTSPGMNKAPIPIAGGWANGGSMMKYSGMETRNAKGQDKDLISWMKGVKFGKRGTTSSERRKSRKLSALTDMRSLDMDHLAENLSDEIIHVGERFTKVKFEEADVTARHVKVSLNGPWSSDGKLAYLQLRMDFPQDYPENTPPQFQLEHTSALPEAKFTEIENGLRTIAMGYLAHRKGCLEAVLSYLLGERDLQESTEWLTLGDDPLDSAEQDDSSSDEEDALIGDPGPGESQTLDMEDSMGSGILSTNTNVPIPRTCSALWAADGRLICFFPPKEEPKSILQRAALADSSRLRGSREMIFEGFGRLHADSPDPTLRNRSIQEDSEEDESSDDSSATSSSTSSSSSEGPDMVPTQFRPPEAWHGGSLRIAKLKTNSNDGSLPTSNGLPKKPAYVKYKTVIVLHNVDEILPSKRCLAKDYLLFGDGASLCAHNSEIAVKNQLPDIANVWGLIQLILTNDVPLSILTSNGNDSVAVLAQRAMVRIKRKDSGLDLSFDQPGDIMDPHLKGLVKWGNHPFAATWLIQRLFDHYEASADVQMLAMLSCVFAQSALEAGANEGTSLDLPASMRLPAQLREYYPTREAALGLNEPTVSISDSPFSARTPGTVYGSAESSALNDSDPLTPFSARYTPPMPLSRGSTQLSSIPQSLSTSPERHRVSSTSAHSSFAASMWARPFNLASSPPTRQRLSGEDMSGSGTLSNSNTPVNNSRVFHRSDSTIRNSYMAQGLADEYDGGSSTDDDEPPPPKFAIRLSMKNQNLFDEEATASVPFLDAGRADKHTFYREAYARILGVWGLEMQRNEVLKYNGIVSGGLPKRGDRDSHSTLTLGRSHTHHGADGEGPHIVRCCSKCHKVEIHAVGGKLDTRCSRCKTKSQIMPCTVCMQPVLGLYKACLLCGHAAHASCLQLLLVSLHENELESECEVGCGCDHSDVENDTYFVEWDDPPSGEVTPREDNFDFHAPPRFYNNTLHSRRGTVTNIPEDRRLAAERSRHEAIRPKTTQHGRRRSFVPY